MIDIDTYIHDLKSEIRLIKDSEHILRLLDNIGMWYENQKDKENEKSVA